MVIVALPCFVIWELGERHPAIDLRLFAYRNYTVAVICSVLGFLVIQGLLSVFAVQLQLLLGYSSSLAGLVYLSMIFLSVPLVAIIHELCRKFDVRLIACLNFLGFAAIMMWIGLFDKIDYFDQIALPMIFFGLSLAAFFAPLAAIEEGRRIFERMNSYAIYRIAETIRVLFLMTASILIFNFYPVTAIMVVLLALLNDLPIMMIAYDNAPIAPQPVRWDMTRVLTIASVLGGYGVLSSFVLFWVVRNYLALSPPNRPGADFPQAARRRPYDNLSHPQQGPSLGASLAELGACRSLRDHSANLHYAAQVGGCSTSR